MNPMLQAALGAVIRAGLMSLAGWLVNHKVWTESEATMYVSAATVAILTTGWAVWRVYRNRIKLLTAIAHPDLDTEEQVEAKIRSSTPNPSVTTPKDVVPVPKGPA